jgi:tetrapyrrole methylase family protein/MazG family protein
MNKPDTPSTKKGITLLGLGSGSPGALTREAWDWLEKTQNLHLRTQNLPLIADLPKTLKWKSFDAVIEAGEDVEAAYATVIETILALGEDPEGVTYAVPGHPCVGEATCPEIIKRAREAGIPVRVIDGLSFLETTFRALEKGPFPNVVLMDALTLAMRHTPGFPPSSPAVVTQISSRKLAAEVKTTLMAVYPGDHLVQWVHGAGTAEEMVEEMPLEAIDQSPHYGLVSSLFIPPLTPNASFESFQEVVARLRAPDGCPWDREQTHQSLRPFLIEEAYEALDALDQGNMSELAEELGDLLLQIVLHAQIATEHGDFNIHDVINGIGTKLIRRHPHVFSKVEVEGVSGVIRNWEAIKAEERKENGDSGKKGLLDGVPKALPALLQADEIVERVGRVKFDQLATMGSVEFIRSKLDDIMAMEEGDRSAEFGELLLGVVSLAHKRSVEPESALREAIARFRVRFGTMEASALANDRPLVELSKDEMEGLWAETPDTEDQDV